MVRVVVVHQRFALILDAMRPIRGPRAAGELTTRGAHAVSQDCPQRPELCSELECHDAGPERETTGGDRAREQANPAKIVTGGTYSRLDGRGRREE